METKTENQKIARTRNYRKFYGLLQQMPGGVAVDELKDTLVSQFTDARTVSAHEMTGVEFAAMLAEMEAQIQAAKGRYAELDKARKRVLKSIIAMHELNGIHAGDKIAHAKGTALRNMGVSDEIIKKYGANRLFNEIRLNDLRCIYNWANRQQKLIKNGNETLAETAMKLAGLN